MLDHSLNYRKTEILIDDFPETVEKLIVLDTCGFFGKGKMVEKSAPMIPFEMITVVGHGLIDQSKDLLLIENKLAFGGHV